MKNITVKAVVSATSANIGAGFDCMGLALDLCNTVELSYSESGKLEIITDDCFPRDRSNLVYRSVKALFDHCSEPLPPLKIVQKNEIPAASGLGSSAACIAAGIGAANALIGSPLSEQQLIDLATGIDTHPDNVVPAFTGGITAGVMENGKVEYIKCDAPESLVLYAATPDFPLETERSRRALPDSYSRTDAVYSLSRAVLTFAALVSKRVDMLKVIGDRLHEPYRKPLIPGYDIITAAFKDAGALSSYLSGAGPTIMGVFDREAEPHVPPNWTLRRLHIVNSGIKIKIGD